VIAYFGAFPIWFPAFLLSCKNNPNIHWMIWNDCSNFKGDFPENVTSVPMTLEEYKSLATDILNTKINIGTPHKLCDFKPIYGDIFKEQLKGFDYWGHCDLDLIWGDIESFLTRIEFQKFDIISTRSNSVCGHFTLYRNIASLNKFYTQVDNFQKVFLKPSYSGLKGWRWENGKIFDEKGNERIYLHFMKWKKSLNRIDFNYDDPPSQFMITKNGLWSKNMSFIEKIRYHLPTHYGHLIKHNWIKLKWFFNHSILKKPTTATPLIPEGYKTI